MQVTNNWWPDEVVGGPLYEDGLSVNDLYERSLQSLYEFNPIQPDSLIYRKQRFGKHLEIFFLDFRSYRDPNSENDSNVRSNMMGEEQLAWLKSGLKESTATWKILSSHDPLGIITGGTGDWDSYGQGDPQIKGREYELKDLLGFINDEGVTGVVSLTSDVHFTAYVNMSPENAQGNFTGFKPLDEFVIGPIHAGEFVKPSCRWSAAPADPAKNLIMLTFIDSLNFMLLYYLIYRIFWSKLYGYFVWCHLRI
jgi:alkaline phosphatase D